VITPFVALILLPISPAIPISIYAASALIAGLACIFLDETFAMDLKDGIGGETAEVEMTTMDAESSVDEEDAPLTKK
jgi:hypothetical protein